MQHDILNFIQKRWQKDADWTNGNCFWFAYILKTRFPRLEIYYLPTIGHFIAGADDTYYDYHGTYVPDEAPFLLSDIKQEDPIWYNRIIRDCVL